MRRSGRAVIAAMSGALVALATLWSTAGPDLRAQDAVRPPDPGRQVPPERIEDAPETEAIVRYRAAAEESEAPIDWYNYGTVLLDVDRWERASEALRRAAEGDEREVELFARYNLALASARSGSRGSGAADERRERLREARNAFRAVLRRDPADEDARWNLELVQRWLREQEGGSGAGAGAGQARSSGTGSAMPAGGDQAGDPVELDPGEAQALLDAAGDAESAVRDRMLERARLRDPVVERNW